MLDRVLNLDKSNPRFKKNIKTLQWSLLFIFDLIFGFTARKKNKSNLVLKKFKNKTFIGKCFISTHKSNVKKILRDNKNYHYLKAIELPSILAKDFNSEGFSHWKKKINQPLVIKNYLRDAPILELTSLERLIKDHGEKEVVCINSDTATGKKDESNVGQNVQSKKTTLKEFLTLPEFENHYINNFFGLFNNDTFLKYGKGKDIEELLGKPNVLTQWFVARKQNTGSVLHCAPPVNMFLNIKGRKEWFFIDPSYSSIIEPSMAKHGIYCVSEFEESFKEDFHTSLVKKYPYMKHVPIYRTILEDGDMLYNPPWWWHRVENLSPQTTGIATRFESPSISLKNNKTFTIGIFIESLKNPKKSLIYLAIKSKENKDNAKKFIDSIFSLKEKN